MAWDHGSGDIAAGGARRKEELEDERSVKSASGERGGLGMGAGVPGGGGTVEGVLYVKVMTDEQMEVLRKQISVYSTICDQLVEMHKALTAQEDSIAGSALAMLTSCIDLLIEDTVKTRVTRKLSENI